MLEKFRFEKARARSATVPGRQSDAETEHFEIDLAIDQIPNRLPIKLFFTVTLSIADLRSEVSELFISIFPHPGRSSEVDFT